MARFCRRACRSRCRYFFEITSRFRFVIRFDSRLTGRFPFFPTKLYFTRLSPPIWWTSILKTRRTGCVDLLIEKPICVQPSECSEAEANLRGWAGLIQAPITRRS